MSENPSLIPVPEYDGSVLNPLLVDTILETVIEFMDHDSQKSGRLVCSKWNHIIHPKFIKKTTVQVLFEATTENNFVVEQDLISIFPSNSEESKRYRNFNIHSMTWLDSMTFRGWLAGYGKSIQTLTLGKGEEEEMDDLEDNEEINLCDLETLLLDWCPNLKELSLPIPCIQTLSDAEIGKIPIRFDSALEILNLGSSKWFRDDYEDIGFIARLALQIAPGLKVLSMNSCQNLGVDLLIQNAPGNPIGMSLERLHTLDLHRQIMNPSIIDELTRLNFTNLRKLGLGDFGEVEDPTRFWASVTRLLQNVGNSLEHLSLGETYHGSLYIEDFPLMPELKTFCNHHARGWTFRSMELLSNFPKLQYCMIDSRCVDSCHHSEGLVLQEYPYGTINKLIQNPHTKLSTLVLSCGIEDIAVLKRIVIYFPNLKALHINMESRYSLQIVKCFEELAKLLKIERLWVKTKSACLIHNEQFLKEYLSNSQGLRSLVIEGDKYLYMKLEETVQGIKPGCNDASLFKDVIIPVIHKEFKMNEIQLGRLQDKFKKTDLSLWMVDMDI